MSTEPMGTFQWRWSFAGCFWLGVLIAVLWVGGVIAAFVMPMSPTVRQWIVAVLTAPVFATISGYVILFLSRLVVAAISVDLLDRDKVSVPLSQTLALAASVVYVILLFRWL